MEQSTIQLLDTAAIFRYHHSLIEEHGSGTTASLGWLATEGQQARFEVLAGIGDLNDHSLLDAGCGHADLYPFLKAHYPRLRYFGVEQMPELLDVVATRYGEEEDMHLFTGDFLQADLPHTDYVIACGALSYRRRDEAAIYTAIQKLFNGCRLGLGFNLLSREPAAGGLLAAYQPEAIMRFCRELSPKAELVTGYLEGDFTVFVYH